MSTADSIMVHNQYMTKEVFEEFFEVQAKSLRGEFRYIHDRVDQGIQHIDQKFEAVDGEFHQVHDKIDKGFQRVDHKFDAIDEKFHNMDHKMNQNDARARNYRLARLHQKIQMITVLDTTSGIKTIIKTPLIFPATVKEFWNLMMPQSIVLYILYTRGYIYKYFL